MDAPTPPARTPDEVRSVVDAAVADSAFSGVVRVEIAHDAVVETAAGLAERRYGIANSARTRFGLASGTKTFTALAVVRLAELGLLDLDGPARRWLASDLPLIDDDVTIAHLLTHRSGAGDYFPESDIDDFSAFYLPVPPGRLDSIEAYLPLVDGLPQVSPPGERFSYNNGGYVVLALIVERVSSTTFGRAVDDLVCGPAGLTSTGFHRSDDLPPDLAIGYLAADGGRTNALHLPVIGGGDGGISSTAADISRLWRAFVAGRIVNEESVALMTTRHGSQPSGAGYGMGLWLSGDDSWWEMEGSDVGVSFRSRFHPATGTIHTVVSNVSDGAWAVSDALVDLFADR